MIASQSAGKETAVDESVARGRLHPAVGRENPERGEQRSHRHHDGGEEMHPARHQPPAEQQHAEKRGFEEERGEAFIGEQRREHVGGDVGEAAPVGAELERHDDAGHHAHAERDREQLGPEPRQPEPDRPLGEEIEALEHRDIGREPDGEGRQQDVPGDDPHPLQARQQNRIERHGHLATPDRHAGRSPPPPRFNAQRRLSPHDSGDVT